MTIPQNIPKSRPQAIASYNYIDIADGTGVVVLYGASNKNQTTEKFFIENSKTYSNSIVANGNTNNTVFEKTLDEDYDMIFNFPKTIKGIIRANITIGGGYLGVLNSSGEVYAIIKIRHWDGTTETDLGNAQTETLAFPGYNTPKSKVMNVEIDLTAGKHFRKDETLRITIELWGRKTGGNGVGVAYGRDPKGRIDPGDDTTYGPSLDGADTTSLIFNVPFKLDI